jgi:hypothetical protein
MIWQLLYFQARTATTRFFSFVFNNLSGQAFTFNTIFGGTGNPWDGVSNGILKSAGV